MKTRFLWFLFYLLCTVSNFIVAKLMFGIAWKEDSWLGLLYHITVLTFFFTGVGSLYLGFGHLSKAFQFKDNSLSE